MVSSVVGILSHHKILLSVSIVICDMSDEKISDQEQKEIFNDNDSRGLGLIKYGDIIHRP